MLSSLLFSLFLVGCESLALNATPAPVATPTINLEGIVSESTGAVQLTLTYASEAGRPVRTQLVLLADLIPVTGGTLEGAFVPALHAATAPGAQTDENGRVVIPNVAPGRYGVILMTPTGPMLLASEEDDGRGLLVEVEAGKLTDLGQKETSVTPDLLEP